MTHTRANSAAAPSASSGGFVRDRAGGRVECERCRTRVFSRNPLVLAIWESVHTSICHERPHVPLPTSAVIGS